MLFIAVGHPVALNLSNRIGGPILEESGNRNQLRDLVDRQRLIAFQLKLAEDQLTRLLPFAF